MEQPKNCPNPNNYPNNCPNDYPNDYKIDQLIWTPTNHKIHKMLENTSIERDDENE